MLGILAAVLFALTLSIRAKLGVILSLLLLLFAVQWMVLHGFGMFFDAFVPVVGLGLHSLYERLLGRHETGSTAQVH